MHSDRQTGIIEVNDQYENMTRSIYTVLLPIMLMIALSACYPPNQQAQQPGQPAPTDVYTTPIVDLIDAAEDLSTELKEKGLPNTVESWVENLIVTAQPGSGMPEIARMKVGEKATYLHQRTLLRKEAVLRDQRFKARYILIQLSSGQMGWVHEGGIKYVYPRFQKVLDEVVATATSTNQRTRGGGAVPVLPATEQRVIVPGIKVGPIRKNTSQEDIVEIYGGTQVGLSTVKTPEGDEPCTVVFPGEPSELRITWKNAERTQIKAVYIDKRESTWFTREGLGVGLPLTEIAKVNQHPFSFYGLDWQYGGVIESWKNGSMSKYKKAFYGVMAPARSNSPIPSNFTGDKLISSNDSGTDNVELVLGRLVVYLD